MNRDETSRVLAVLTAHWPNHTIPNPEGTLMAYQVGLDDVPYDAAMAAAETAIKTCRFFPTVAELRELVLDAIGGFPSAEEAWREIRQGFAEGGIYAEPRWSCWALAETVRTIGWRVLCTSREGDLDVTERFALTFRTYRKRQLATLDIGALAAGRAATAVDDGARYLPWGDE